MSSSRGRSLKSRFVALVFLVVVAAASAALAHPLRQTVVPSADTAVCGVERWAVKTLQDRPRLLPVYKTTVRQLVRLPRPAYLPNTRLPVERHVYSVIASATLLREEDDQAAGGLRLRHRRAPRHDVGDEVGSGEEIDQRARYRALLCECRGSRSTLSRRAGPDMANERWRTTRLHRRLRRGVDAPRRLVGCGVARTAVRRGRDAHAACAP
jgi:hypothetical protein